MKGLPTNISSEKLRFFESTLLDFFEKAGREHLPWRREGISAYEVWVSEIMLQQTQVSRVISYYEKFLECFPTVESLARASWEEFLPYYAGLGYYARGRNMLRTARMVVDEFGGEFPNDITALQKLPGVGTYTASAIASFAHGEEYLAWDTNLRRVVGRFFFGTKSVGDWHSESANSKSGNLEAKRLKKRTVLSRGNTEWQHMNRIGREFSLSAKVLNAALMDFGSAMCVGKPKCAACPLQKQCRYYREHGSRENARQAEGKQKSKIQNRKSYGGSERFDWKDARVEVTLHEDHRKYFSSLKTSYTPFFVPASHNTRAGIKQWFRDRYGLEVSVRLPHRRECVRGVPMLFVNAQVLSGQHRFAEFSKETVLAG